MHQDLELPLHSLDSTIQLQGSFGRFTFEGSRDRCTFIPPVIRTRQSSILKVADIMCKAQQSYLPYLTAADSGALPLNITIQACAGYMLAYNAATQNTSRITGCRITEPTLFDISHCPIFKLVPVFVSNKDFVVLDFASLPKVDAVQSHRTSSHSTTANTPIVEAFHNRSGSASTTATLQKVDEVAKSYAGPGITASTPTVDAFQKRQSTSTRVTTGTNTSTLQAVQFKSTAMDGSPNTLLGKTKPKPIVKEIEILSTKNVGEWTESPTMLLSGINSLTTTNGKTIDSSIVSPMTPKKIMYSPRTLRNIGRGMMSNGMGNEGMSPGRIFTGVKIVKHECINSASPRLEKVKEEDVEWPERAVKWLEEADSVAKEV